MRLGKGLVLLFLTLTLVTPHLFAQKAQSSADENTVRHLENEWLNAYFKGDVATMDRIEADDFTVAATSGQYTKQQQLDNIRKRQTLDTQVTHSAQDLQIRLYETVALVTGVSVTRSAEAKNADRDVFTEVWVKRNGEWKVVHLQCAPLQKKS